MTLNIDDQIDDLSERLHGALNASERRVGGLDIDAMMGGIAWLIDSVLREYDLDHRKLHLLKLFDCLYGVLGLAEEEDRGDMLQYLQ